MIETFQGYWAEGLALLCLVKYSDALHRAYRTMYGHSVLCVWTQCTVRMDTAYCVYRHGVLCVWTQRTVRMDTAYTNCVYCTVLCNNSYMCVCM